MPAKKNSDLVEINEALRASFKRGALSTYEQRVAALIGIRKAITDHYDEACDALGKDLGRSRTEASGELQLCLSEVKTMLSNLREWMKPEAKSTHLLLTPGHTQLRREAFGVLLVIAPFNYPMNLGLVPLIGAIAAGNTVVLKPSEQTVACEKWFLGSFGRVVNSDLIRVVDGDVPRTTALLACKWDFIFFTGSPRVGQVVMRAAAEHLTPTVMELGGKAPVVVGPSCASVKEAARRIAMGKWINAGQTCMAPDYVLVHDSKHAELVSELVKCAREFYGPDPAKSGDYGRMCTVAHAQRACALVASSGGAVRCGGPGAADPAARFVPPTVVDCPAEGSDLMTQEIFGPVLPVLPYTGAGVAGAVARIRAVDPTPLALYVFADRSSAEQLMGAVQSGDVIVNDTFMHAINPDIPFGGVGRAGYGTYRGRYSYDAFTFQRGVLWRSGTLDIDQTLPFNVRYPPSGQARKMLLPHAVGLFPCVPPLFTWRPRLFSGAALAVTVAAIIFGAEAAGAPPITYAAGVVARYLH